MIEHSPCPIYRGVDDEDAANTLDETIQEPHADDLNVVDEAACARLCEADEGKLGDDTDLEGEKEQQMIDILAHRQAERYGKCSTAIQHAPCCND